VNGRRAYVNGESEKPTIRKYGWPDVLDVALESRLSQKPMSLGASNIFRIDSAAAER
jgi:hypothetical protein